jgi:hypothetical protein
VRGGTVWVSPVQVTQAKASWADRRKEGGVKTEVAQCLGTG